MFNNYRNIMMLLLLFVVISKITTKVHAGTKRVVIKVPQRTKHIYHHHVKKVPVYVLLPDRKPKGLDDIDEITKQLPCKESSWNDERASKYRYGRYYEDENKDSYANWMEDKENKGAYMPAEHYRTVDEDYPLPPLDHELPFRRVNANHKQEYDLYQTEHHNYNSAQYQSQPHHLPRNPPPTPEPESIHFTYPPTIEMSLPTNIPASSYQYRIEHRNHVLS